MRTKIGSIALAVLALAPVSVAAAPSPPGGSWNLAAAIKAGGRYHGLFSGLHGSFDAELEAGFLALGGRLEVDVTLAYAKPPASDEGSDPRFASGGFSWDIAQDVFAVGVLARYRFLPMASPWNVYAGAGPRLHFLRTVADGDAGGASFGENEQTSTEIGFALHAGTELKLGPGRALAELAFGAGPIDGLLTGDASTAGIGLLLGYRFVF